MQEPIHPSEFIQEELDARNWSMDDLATRMGGDPSRNRLVLDVYFLVGPKKTNCRISKKTAKQFSEAFGVSAQYFLNMEKAWVEAIEKARQN